MKPDNGRERERHHFRLNLTQRFTRIPNRSFSIQPCTHKKALIMATLPDAQQQQKVPPGQEDQAAKDYHHSESKAGVVVQTPSSCVADFCLIPVKFLDTNS